MHPHLRRSGAVALFLGATSIMPAACASNDSSIFIRACLAATDRTTCLYQIQVTSEEIFFGTLDAAYAGEYHCVAAVENQMVPRGDPNRLKTETSGVELYEAEVQVLDPAQNNAAIKQFSVPITGFIDPGMSGQAGVGGTDITMIDAATVQVLAAKVAATGKVQEVVASVIARGRTLGGAEVHTQEFLFPIEVFVGTSCSQPAGMSCCGGMSSTMSADCRLGVDEPGGSNCQAICSSLGACGRLECNIDLVTMKSDLLSAHCPAHVPPDASCCNP
jgi:hypothetical protein